MASSDLPRKSPCVTRRSLVAGTLALCSLPLWPIRAESSLRRARKGWRADGGVCSENLARVGRVLRVESPAAYSRLRRAAAAEFGRDAFAPESVKALLDERRRQQEFEAGATFTVDGWVLSVSEATACAVAVSLA